MPELPEVETSRRGITPYLLNETIAQITVRQPQLRWRVPDEVIHCQNEKIIAIDRRGKYLLLQLHSGWIVIHLGMSGSLRILTTPTPLQKHDHIDLQLQNGLILRYNDARRFGSWLWTTDCAQLPQLASLGVEPLSSEFTAAYLTDAIKKRTAPIKTVIMDSHLVVGVGNIYASEALFLSQISPFKAANQLTVDELERLVKTIQEVLEKAIDAGGTTLKDFVQADGKPGYFAQKLSVYGRQGSACEVCGDAIQSTVIGQRNTFFCPTCQSCERIDS